MVVSQDDAQSGVPYLVKDLLFVVSSLIGLTGCPAPVVLLGLGWCGRSIGLLALVAFGAHGGVECGVEALLIRCSSW